MALEISVNDNSLQAQSLMKKMQEEIKAKAAPQQEDASGTGVAVKVDISEKGRQMAGSAGAEGLSGPADVKEATKKKLEEEIKRIKEEIEKVKKDTTLTDEQKEKKLSELNNQLVQLQGEYMKLIDKDKGIAGNVEGTSAKRTSESFALKGTMGQDAVVLE